MKKTFDIIRYSKISFAVSGVVVALSVLSLLVFGLKPGIDFTGGSLMELSFESQRPQNQEIVDIYANYGGATVQPVDDLGVLVRLRFISEEEHKDILSALREKFETEGNRVLEQRFETIGPTISAQLRERSVYIIIMVIIAIVLYVAYAFRRVSRPIKSWKYGVAAIVALVHDILITLGVFSLLGRFFNVEVDIAFVVALMTILGYSVNDTIVVFDRIRENLIKKGSDRFVESINEGVTETIARSINTSGTTLLVLFALFLFAGSSIRYFALALIVGITAGTYSSIFLAAPFLHVWYKLKRR